MSFAPDSLLIPLQNWHSSPQRVRKPKIFKQKTNIQICPECEHVRMESFTSCCLHETCFGSLPSSKSCQQWRWSHWQSCFLPNTLSITCESVSLNSRYLHWPAQSIAILFVPALLSAWLNAESEGESGSACKITWQKLWLLFSQKRVPQTELPWSLASSFTSRADRGLQKWVAVYRITES